MICMADFGGLADGDEAAGPGAPRRDEADVADHRHGLVGHALDRRIAGAAVDGVGIGLEHAEGPADEVVGGADLEEVLARHGEEARRGVAVLRVSNQRRRHRDDVDPCPLGGLGLVERHHPQHGQLALALHRAEVGDGRSLACHRAHTSIMTFPSSTRTG